MNKNAMLAKAVSVIAFVFAAFSGFLTKIAPPEDAEAPFAVGIASFLALVILLLISAMAGGGNRRSARKRRLWLSASLFFFMGVLVFAFFYKSDLGRLTFGWPPEDPTERAVAGTEWTQDAAGYLRTHPGKSVSEIVADYGGPPQVDSVWTADSIQNARMRLTIDYAALIVCLATTIFCLTEGALANGATLSRRRSAAARGG